MVQLYYVHSFTGVAGWQGFEHGHHSSGFRYGAAFICMYVYVCVCVTCVQCI